MTGRLHPDDVQAIARAVVALLREQPAATSSPALIDAAEVARRFGVTAEWVRDHAEDLGAVRLGKGTRPRLRFDPERVAAALSSSVVGGASEREEVPAQAGVRRRRRAEESDNEAGLLPIFTLNSPESDKSKRGGRRANGSAPATRSRPSPRAESTGSRAAERSPRSHDRGGHHGT